jgi:hypothetical protein
VGFQKPPPTTLAWFFFDRGKVPTFAADCNRLPARFCPHLEFTAATLHIAFVVNNERR